MNDFMLIYKGGDPKWMENTSKEEMAASMEKWGAWMGMLEQKQQLVSNIAAGLSQATESVQQRMVAQFSKADPEYGRQIQSALK